MPEIHPIINIDVVLQKLHFMLDLFCSFMKYFINKVESNINIPRNNHAYLCNIYLTVVNAPLNPFSNPIPYLLLPL